MEKVKKIGIARETNIPPDKRVALIPADVAGLKARYPSIEFSVQSSVIRCYSDEEYRLAGVEVVDNLDDHDLIIGVKEVAVDKLMESKTYVFFAHVAKKQPYNQGLLQEIMQKKITLIDYEYLANEMGIRVIAFGRWAGIVGAYKALLGKGIKKDGYTLKPPYQCFDLEEMFLGLKNVEIKPGKIIVTGEGRAAGGALEILYAANIKQVSPRDYLNMKFDYPVFTRIGPQHYTRDKSGEEFNFGKFINDPDQFEPAFAPYAKTTDILVACHFWEPGSPVLFTREEMVNPDFRISLIADVSCDINGSIPSTIRPSAIDSPFYDYNPFTGKEEKPFSGEQNLTVMAVDNLPNELPRNASADFSNTMKQAIIPAFIEDSGGDMIRRATIVEKGKLTKDFAFLKDFANRDL